MTKALNKSWRKGTVMWLVPIRFWENEYQPIRCVIVTDNGIRRRDDDYSVFAFHGQWKHNVYLSPFDLYPTRKECKAEIARRRQMRVEESDYEVLRVMKRVKAGKQSLKTIGCAITKSWKRSDALSLNRFYDHNRFKKTKIK